jgi:hypothetical protein
MGTVPKVRILADVPVETKQKLDEVVHELRITKVDFFTKVIEDYHKQYVHNKTNE